LSDGLSPRFRRRLRHHVVIGLAAVAAGVLVDLAFNLNDLRQRVSTVTAYVSLGCVALSLIRGPLNLLRGRANPVSSDLRRDLGIWGGVVGLVHVGVGLTVHLRGKMHLYFFPPPEVHAVLPLRADPFGAANYLGLISGVVLLMLLALSNDISLRLLGAPRWKAWQRWNYIAAAAMFVHGALYQVLEHRKLGFVSLFAAVVAATLAFQALGYRITRAGAGPTRP
jgi:sulfoxide reductase heme-binding subunit YedZ